MKRCRTPNQLESLSLSEWSTFSVKIVFFFPLGHEISQPCFLFLFALQGIEPVRRPNLHRSGTLVFLAVQKGSFPVWFPRVHHADVGSIKHTMYFFATPSAWIFFWKWSLASHKSHTNESRSYPWNPGYSAHPGNSCGWNKMARHLAKCQRAVGNALMSNQCHKVWDLFCEVYELVFDFSHIVILRFFVTCHMNRPWIWSNHLISEVESNIIIETWTSRTSRLGISYMDFTTS